MAKMRVQLVETKDLRRLHIGSIFVDLNESDYQDLINIFSISRYGPNPVMEKEMRTHNYLMWLKVARSKEQKGIFYDNFKDVMYSNEFFIEQYNFRYNSFHEKIFRARNIEDKPPELESAVARFKVKFNVIDELYELRKAYNAVLFNEWARLGKYEVHKSRKHHDGTLCFGGGWFIVVAVLPGGQITNHYEEKDWELFKIPEEDVAKYEFDGHTSKDVINRLLALYQHEYSLISNERFWRDLLLNNGNQ